MIEYIKSLLPRLKEYSRQLDDTTLLAEHPWIVINEDGQKINHVFRRNNELLVSIKGDVVKGKWEYLPAMNALLIEYSGKSWLYNQGFIDPGVMVLQKDGTDDLFVLANQNLVPDLDVMGYLEQKTIKKLASVDDPIQKPKPVANLVRIKLKRTHRYIKVQKQSWSDQILKVGNRVFDENGAPLPDGKYFTADLYTLKVVDGRLAGIEISDEAIFWAVLIILMASFLIYILVGAS